MKYYLIEVWGCVEPGIPGGKKFKTRKERDKFAKDFHAGKDFDGDRDVLFWADVDSKGNLKVGSYQAEFFFDCDYCGEPMSEHDDGSCPMPKDVPDRD